MGMVTDGVGKGKRSRRPNLIARVNGIFAEAVRWTFARFDALLTSSLASLASNITPCLSIRVSFISTFTPIIACLTALAASTA
tara:strand:+ start:160 stop:408 length:249 start_codon:yes stop_codon:yes gene_type:complete